MTRTAVRRPPAFRQPAQPGTLRAQTVLVIGLLTFLPNVLVALSLAYVVGIPEFDLMLAWMLALAAISIGFGYFLSLALVRPLLRLEGEVRGGHFYSGHLHSGHLQEAHSDDPGEVRALREAFSRLLSRLTTEQERRGAFMATLVHDLKTPLIATAHLVRVLRSDEVPHGEREGVYAQLLGENARLLNLVQQMADAHKFEREGVTLTKVSVNLRELAERLALRSGPTVRERALTFELRGEASALVDEVQFERAVANLLDNALRYAKSEVRLEVAPDLLRVLDDGPGLARPLADLAQPFNAQPVDIAGRRYTAGLAGLGLFIARSVVEAHGGDLAYAREDDWSAFTLRWENAEVKSQESRVKGTHARDPRPATRDASAGGAP